MTIVIAERKDAASRAAATAKAGTLIEALPWVSTVGSESKNISTSYGFEDSAYST